MRQVPIASEAEVQTMLTRMKRKVADKVELGNKAGSVPSDNVVPAAPTPKESLPNSLGASEVETSITPRSDPTEVVGVGPIRWKRGPDDWTILSACGNFKIRKRCIEPATSKLEAEFSYEAFHIATGQWDFSLGIKRDPREARQLCEDHETMLQSMRRRA